MRHYYVNCMLKKPWEYGGHHCCDRVLPQLMHGRGVRENNKLSPNPEDNNKQAFYIICSTMC